MFILSLYGCNGSTISVLYRKFEAFCFFLYSLDSNCTYSCYGLGLLVIKQDVSIWALTIILVLLRILVHVQMQHINQLFIMDLEQQALQEN